MNFPAKRDWNFGSGRSDVRLAVILPIVSICALFLVFGWLQLLLRTVAATGLLTTVYTQGVSRATNYLVTNPWQVTNSSTTY